MDKISQINKVIKQYFESNGGITKIPAKDLMPYFIAAGIFEKDAKNGLPIRQVLRKLDKSNALHAIPYVLAERKEANTYWFFSSTPQVANKAQSIRVPQPAVSKATSKRTHSDEHYIIDLCDEVLGAKGSRQHRFPFLTGDTGRALPVDVYYPQHNLVIEYLEKQHSEAVKFFDKPDKLTASGVPRSEQRKIYDERRRTILPQHGIRLIALPYSMFACTSAGKLCRNRSEDLAAIRSALAQSDKVH
jgi:hypothetical protein